MGHIKPCTDNAAPHALALLRVNRQIHAEAHLIPYLHNTFEGRHSGHLRTWIESLSEAHRKAITSVKHHQRSYIIESVAGLDVSPIFWMDTPEMGEWKLEGLRRIQVEVVLNNWGWENNEEEATKVRTRTLRKLRELVESEHAGIVVDVVLKRR